LKRLWRVVIEKKEGKWFIDMALLDSNRSSEQARELMVFNEENMAPPLAQTFAQWLDETCQVLSIHFTCSPPNKDIVFNMWARDTPVDRYQRRRHAFVRCRVKFSRQLCIGSLSITTILVSSVTIVASPLNNGSNFVGFIRNEHCLSFVEKFAKTIKGHGWKCGWKYCRSNRQIIGEECHGRKWIRLESEWRRVYRGKDTRYAHNEKGQSPM
jgi:hypothetical protein